MLRGNLPRSRLLWQRVPTRTPTVLPLRFFPAQKRHFSAKPDLFTLDIDLETDADVRAPKTVPKPEHRIETTKAPSEAAADSISGENADTVAHTKPNGTTESEESDDRDKLDDILADIAFDSTENTDKSNLDIDSLFGDLFSQKQSTTWENSSLDQLSDFDPDGASGRQNPELPSDKHSGSVLTDEKELFEKIFATYTQTEDVGSTSSDKLQKQVLSNLQESFFTVNKSPDPAPIPQPIESLSEKENSAIESNTLGALRNTLTYIDSLGTKEEVVDFARSFLDRFRAEFSKTSFYLHKLKGESSKKYLARHAELSEQIETQSEVHPETPLLNVFTMPVIFNRVISVVTTKHQDGALALSLFNSAKEDLNLYTNVCNQKTYNEMLKVLWVFFGKRSLCEVELIVVEMMNNGFAGDKYTFAILKEILATYYAMKSGSSSYNPGGVPIWSKEDEKRARNLAGKLKVLGRSLQKESFFSKGVGRR